MTKRVLLYFALLLWFVVPSLAQPTIFVESTSIVPNEQTTVLVRLADFEKLVSMQFSVNWDPAVLQFDSVATSGILPDYSSTNFGFNSVAQGDLLTSWVDMSLQGVDIADTVQIFTIHFTGVGNIGENTTVEITGEPSVIEFSTADGVIFGENDLTIQNGTVTVEEPNSVHDLRVQSNAAFTLYQNEPNPFENQTIIRFDVREASDFNLEIYDPKGTKVYEIKHFYATGSHSIQLDRNMLPANGTYFYKLKTKDYFITNRMILVRE